MVQKSNELESRLIRFTSHVLHLVRRISSTAEGRHIGQQLMRAGTSPAANYAEARAAESHADFIHKMRIVEKELNETQVWINMIRESALVQPEQLTWILDENNQLCRIVSASVRTARARQADPERDDTNGRMR